MKFAFKRRPEGKLEIRFQDEALFDRVRDIMNCETDLEEKKLLESPDQIYLDFAGNESALTLHWDNFAGLSLIALDKQSEAALLRVGNRLTSLGFSLDSDPI